MHVVRSWISCRISFITSITIYRLQQSRICAFITHLVVTSVLLQYTQAKESSRWQPCRRWLRWALSLWHLRCVGDGGVVVAEAFYFGASFLFVYCEKASYFINSNCITEVMILICVYACMYVLYIITQYHVFIVYINRISTFTWRFTACFMHLMLLCFIVLCQKWRE